MPGGVARDGWYMIGIGKKKLLRDGVAGSAVIKSFYTMDEASNIGNAQHDFTLEITVPGQAPYELQGLFRIPVRLIPVVDVGTTVPVKVHPSNPKKAVIDWEAWEATRQPSP